MCTTSLRINDGNPLHTLHDTLQLDYAEKSQPLQSATSGAPRGEQAQKMRPENATNLRIPGGPVAAPPGGGAGASQQLHSLPQGHEGADSLRMLQTSHECFEHDGPTLATSKTLALGSASRLEIMYTGRI